MDTGKRGIVSVVVEAAAGKAGAVIVALIVLYGAYNIGQKGLDIVSTKFDAVTAELRTMSGELSGLGSTITGQQNTLQSHERRIERLEERKR